MNTMQPAYHPISFVSPISDTTRRSNPDHANLSTLRRLSVHLKNSFTLEDEVSATRRESIISDHGMAAAETVRRASIASTKDEADDRALQAWRRRSVDEFWGRHGEKDDMGMRRRSVVENSEGEMAMQGRRMSSVGSASGKWRKMSWGGSSLSRGQ